MEQIENKMLIDYYWERPDYEELDRYYEHLAEKWDQEWEDNIDDD